MIHFSRDDEFSLAATHFWLLENPFTTTTILSQRLHPTHSLTLTSHGRELCLQESWASQGRSSSTAHFNTADVVPVALRDNSTIVSIYIPLHSINSSHHPTTCLTKKISLTTRMKNFKPTMQQPRRQQLPMEPQQRRAT